MSSRVPSASPLTRREAAQNASRALVTPRTPAPGQDGGSGQGAEFGFEALQVVVQLDRPPVVGNDPLMSGGHGTR
jgi:hypothetical protein